MTIGERVRRNRRALVWSAVIGLTLFRLAHWHIVWVEEAYGAAAAAQVLRGSLLYRDIWFDKPPLYALFYAAGGTQPGLGLRLSGMLLIIAAAYASYLAARRLWTSSEGDTAALLTTFYLTFGIPSGVMAPAPDLLMIVPHLGAVALAIAGFPVLSGIAAGSAMLVNSKGIFVLAASMLFAHSVRNAALTAGAFVAVHAAAVIFLASVHALNDYLLQVWRWGLAYARDALTEQPVREGITRTANWIGFHAAAAIAASWALYREKSRRLTLWVVLSALAVLAGWRFFPRYYFHLLPVVCVLAARGFALMSSRVRLACALLLLIPAIRFGPRYFILAADVAQGRAHTWSDLRLTEDSRKVAQILRQQARPADDLLVWGYRPEIFIYSGLAAGTRFLDSQPLTGVLADRHLLQSRPTAPELAAANRRELIRNSPTMIVDGLGKLNPDLAITQYPDLAAWLSRYRTVGETELSVVYKLSSSPGGPPFIEKR